MQQCREIAHDTREVSRLTAVVLGVGAFVVAAFWAQLFVIVANGRMIWCAGAGTMSAS